MQHKTRVFSDNENLYNYHNKYNYQTMAFFGDKV